MPLLDKLKKAFIPPDEKAQYAAPAGAHRSRVWMDVSVGDAPAGRIEMELFDETVPKTAANFRELCSGEHMRNGQRAGYQGSTFHRVVPDFMIQGGDFIRGDGTGMYSIYGGAFPDENFKMKHAIPGLLSMANSGPGTNGCQFFITVAPADFLDGKHVVFGRVVEGMQVVKAIENTPTGANDRPVSTVRIAACGVSGAAGTHRIAAPEVGAAHAADPRAGPQDELAATQGGAAGVDPATSATGTSAAPAAHNFEGTGAPVDTSGAPLAAGERPGAGAGLAAGALAGGAGAGLAHQRAPAGAGVGAHGDGEQFHDALEHHDALSPTTTAASVPKQGYDSGAALDSMRSRHDPLDPRSGRGYAEGAELGSTPSASSGYGGGAPVGATSSRPSAFASAAVDFAAPSLRDNVQGDVTARSPEAAAPIHSAGHGGGFKALYRRISRSHDNQPAQAQSLAQATPPQGVPGAGAPTSPSSRPPALGGAVHDYAGTHPVDHRREVDGQLATSPPVNRM